MKSWWGSQTWNPGANDLKKSVFFAESWTNVSLLLLQTVFHVWFTRQMIPSSLLLLCSYDSSVATSRLSLSLSFSISLLDLTQLFLQQDTLLYEVCDLCSLCSHVLSLVSQMILLQPHSPDFEWNGFISSEETNRESKTSKCVLWSLTRVWVHLSLACKNYTSVTVSRLSIDSLNELR